MAVITWVCWSVLILADDVVYSTGLADVIIAIAKAAGSIATAVVVLVIYLKQIKADIHRMVDGERRASVAKQTVSDDTIKSLEQDVRELKEKLLQSEKIHLPPEPFQSGKANLPQKEQP